MKGRYTIPRNQASEVCVSHNATVIPIKGHKLMSVSYYWDNGRIFSNSGLNRRGDTANRGVDVYRLTGALGRATANAKTWSRSNPQTQEAWQAP